MKDKFCPKCGREAEKLFEGMCTDCYLSKKTTINLPAGISVKACKYCGRYFREGKVGGRIAEVIEKDVRDMFESKKRNVKSLVYKIKDGKVHVSVKFDFGGVQKSEEHALDIIEDSFVCQYCSMAETHYYNSIVQIRAPAAKMEKIMQDVRSVMSRLKADRLAFISQIKPMKYGVDLYIGSKGAATKIAKHMKRRFKAELRCTKKVSGKIKGKTISKDTILIIVR